MAICLTRAVLFLHAFSFVHKSIRPENIVIFRSGKANLGKPYLVGFTTGTHHIGDEFWEKNLYRHPQRQDIRPQDDFVM